MKSIFRWAINNTPAMNTLMVAIMATGLLGGYLLRRETFPRFDLEIILVQVPYPGASPEEVERGICQKIEEAVQGIDGIKKVSSVAAEGTGSVIIEVETDAPSVERVLNQVQSEIDRVPSFPDLAEEPEVERLTMRNPAILVGVLTQTTDDPQAEIKLREVVESIRDDLLLIPEVSVANIKGERAYQIDVEISEDVLRKHGLSMQQVAQSIRRQNLELPGGTLRDTSQEFNVRGQHKRLTGEEIARIPIITKPNGTVLTVADLGTVRDDFVDNTSISLINNKPGIAISIEAAAREDLLAMTQAVRDYVQASDLPAGYEMVVWADQSIDVRDRLSLLKKNGLQGLALVFFVLALFLEFRLAFWVAIGIPVAVLGACGVLWQTGETLNMLTMFAFLIALGIVVDDAIVIGENIYAHREQGKSNLQAAIDGTAEVFPSVATSITTTVFAFMPMFFVTGVMGKFFAVLPLAVIAMLILSLVESALILPCHLAHEHGNQSWAGRARAWRNRQQSHVVRWAIAPGLILIGFIIDQFAYPLHKLEWLMGRVNARVTAGLDWLIERVYLPSLRFSLARPAVVISIALSMLIFSFSIVRNGMVPTEIFPELDGREIKAQVVFPDGTPASVTNEAAQRIEQAILDIDKESQAQGEPLIRLTHRLVGQAGNETPGQPSELLAGSHVGTVDVALLDAKDRETTSIEIVKRWRERVGEIAGVESLSFGNVGHSPGGTPIEFKLLATPNNMQSLEAAVEDVKAKLATYPGVLDIADDSRPGKWEIQLKVKDDAKSMGVPLQDLANAVRASYYGEEVQRIQRGRHEVKIMVRYPAEERQSLAAFDNLYVDSGDGVKRPLIELANIEVNRGYSEINRVNQRRSITVSADVNTDIANADTIVRDLQATFMPDLLAAHPGISVRWEGQQEQSVESMQSLFIGLAIALIAMYGLLTFEFRSYLQPAIIMAVIPFGMIGALWGHAIMGLSLTLFSVMGIVALAGVVVNDSIVLVDFINRRVREGAPLAQAVLESGQRRLRPVLLTSLTTVAGLFPILTETSTQAQMLIPMASSLCFGLMLATLLVLILVPVFYSIYGNLFPPKPVDVPVTRDSPLSSPASPDSVRRPAAVAANGHLSEAHHQESPPVSA